MFKVLWLVLEKVLDETEGPTLNLENRMEEGKARETNGRKLFKSMEG